MSATSFVFDDQENTFYCQGAWSIMNVDALFTQLKSLVSPETQNVSVSGAHLDRFDSAGALMLWHFLTTLRKTCPQLQLIHFNQHQLDLLHVVEAKKEEIDYLPTDTREHGVIYQIGEESVNKVHQLADFVALLGDLSDKIYRGCKQWRRFQIPSIVSNVASAGIYALPIVGLLGFLIGVVLAYQMGLQLETYGASIFIAYLSGMAVLREFGPLITAIIVAGRTSSAFTAQISSMKINEEIDALYTMGLSPTELLVVPKVLGLLIALPLLVFWADLFGIIGAMLMSKIMLHVGYTDFIEHLQESVGAKQLLLGLYKAPAFALLIALVGCFQGFRVDANADSVGRQTTRSVVQALFLIIVVDSVYSVIYSWMDL